MFRTRLARRPIFTTTLILATMLCAGCVTSEKSMYVKHLTTRVKQDQQRSADVAMAFGLDEYTKPVLADAGGDSAAQ